MFAGCCKHPLLSIPTIQASCPLCLVSKYLFLNIIIEYGLTVAAFVGEWYGYFAYPDGSKRDWNFKITETANNTVFIGTGSESRGDFDLVAGQVIPAESGSTITFAQTYKSIWAGQIWTYRGTLMADGNTMSGNWYDSAGAGRSRIGTWTVQRGPISPLTGNWKGTYTYPSGSKKDFTLNIPSFTVGAKFKGTGHDTADFTIEGTGVPNVTSHKGGFSWIQKYDSQWHGQIWFWAGLLSEDGKEITGQWHDAVNRNGLRTASFVLYRA